MVSANRVFQPESMKKSIVSANRVFQLNSFGQPGVRKYQISIVSANRVFQPHLCATVVKARQRSLCHQFQAVQPRVSDSTGLRNRAAVAANVGYDVAEALSQGVVDVVVEIVDLPLKEDAVVVPHGLLGDADEPLVHLELRHWKPAAQCQRPCSLSLQKLKDLRPVMAVVLGSSGTYELPRISIND